MGGFHLKWMIIVVGGWTGVNTVIGNKTPTKNDVIKTLQKTQNDSLSVFSPVSNESIGSVTRTLQKAVKSSSYLSVIVIRHK